MRAALFLLLAVSTPPALAQPQPAAIPVSDDALKAALALFEDMDMEQQLRASMAHIMNASLKVRLDAMAEEGKEIPPKVLSRLQALMSEQAELLLGDVMPTIRLDLAAIYVRRFTAEELYELKKLQAHPVMKKAQRLAPEMLAEMAMIGGKAAAARRPEFEAKVEEMVREVMSEEQISDNPAT